MVITLSLLPQKAAGQLNTLVNFESALPTLGGQFSVGVNKQTPPPLRKRPNGRFFFCSKQTGQ